MTTTEPPELGTGVRIRPVVGYEGRYEVTDDGRVWSVPRVVMRKTGSPQTIHGKWKTHSKLSVGGYFAVMLSNGKKNRFCPIHRLVAEAFLGPRPKGMFIDHIDRNPKNNHVSNLRYVTPRKNFHNNNGKNHSWRADRGKWRAYIMVNRRQIPLGHYDTAEEAKAAAVAEKKRRGLHTP